MPGSNGKSITKGQRPGSPPHDLPHVLRVRHLPGTVPGLFALAVALAALVCCSLSPRELQQRELARLYRRLDSLGYARQECRRAGRPLAHMEHEVMAVLDTVRTVFDSGGAALGPPRVQPWHVPGVLSPPQRFWLVSGLLACCVLALYVQRRRRGPATRRPAKRRAERARAAKAPHKKSKRAAPVVAPEKDEKKLYLKVQNMDRTVGTAPEPAATETPPRRPPKVPAPVRPRAAAAPEPRRRPAVRQQPRAQVTPAAQPPAAPVAQQKPRARPVSTPPRDDPPRLGPGAAVRSPVDEIRHRVLSATESGSSPEEIASELGLSADHVRLILRVSRRDR